LHRERTCPGGKRHTKKGGGILCGEIEKYAIIKVYQAKGNLAPMIYEKKWQQKWTTLRHRKCQRFVL
jgi:hypothetical protein